jgi:hypothetical protein
LSATAGQSSLSLAVDLVRDANFDETRMMYDQDDGVLLSIFGRATTGPGRNLISQDHHMRFVRLQLILNEAIAYSTSRASTAAVGPVHPLGGIEWDGQHHLLLLTYDGLEIHITIASLQALLTITPDVLRN